MNILKENKCSSYLEYRYNSLEPGNGESDRHLADFLTRIIEKMNNIERICDLGCGNGYIARRLSDLGYQVTGIDASESGIEIARKAYASDRVEFICMEVKDIVSRKCLHDKFDLVISSDVIEHLYRPADLLQSAYRLLKPKGQLLIGTPYHGYLKNLLLSLLNKWDAHHTVNWDCGHIKFFSVKTLEVAIVNNNYDIRKFYFYGRAPFLWKNMICHARKP